MLLAMVHLQEDTLGQSNDEELNEGLTMKIDLEKSQKQDDLDSEETESTWRAFTDSSPRYVQARFNITQIEVTDCSLENIENTDDVFLHMLIDEGIPVKALSKSSSEDESNIGIIVPPATTANELASGDIDAADNYTVNITDDVENVVEVMGLSKPISNLYLQLIYNEGSMHETENLEKSRSDVRRTSTNPSIILLPENTTSLPVKKKVRFDLPSRKASLVGEYEILQSPVETNSKRNRRKRRCRCPNHLQHNDGLDFALHGEKIDDSLKHIKIKRKRHRYDDTITGEGEEEDEEEDYLNLGSDIEEESDSESQDIIETRDINETCGCIIWTPNWIQIFARIEYFFVVFCVVAIAQGMLYTYSISVTSTLQKRFNLSSRQTGFIFAGDNVTQILVSIFVSFYGANGHRPKWMGYGALSATLAACISAIPHFIYGSGQIANEIVQNPTSAILVPWEETGNRRLELCGFALLEKCPQKGLKRVSEYYSVAVLLFVSQILLGVSTSIFWTIGVSYLDDHISMKKSSLYFAIFTIFRVVGPTLGFSLGGYCLSFWIDPTKEILISHRNPKWLGAWWIGFVILSACIGIPGMLYFCFPRRMPQLKKKKFYLEANSYCTEKGNSCNGDRLQSTNNVLHYQPSTDPKKIRELPLALKRLFTNKIWSANLISNVTFVLAMTGFWNFKPKYIQNQFRKNAGSASFYTGVTTMIASVIGIALSGIVLRWGRPRARYVTAYNVLLSVYAVGSLVVLIFVRCSTPPMAGHLPGQEPWACSSHCDCTEHFSPICAEDGETTFFSPCYAGCASINIYVSPVEYTNCSCFGSLSNEGVNVPLHDGITDDKISPFSKAEGWAFHGFCPSKCNALTYYLSIQLLTKILLASGRVGGILINLRAVERRDITLALGTLSAFVACVGFLPASFLLGSAIDGACLVWEEKCGKQGSCSLYDGDKFRLVMHLIPAAVLVISVICDMVVYFNHSKLDLYGDNERGSSEQEAVLNNDEENELICLKRKSKKCTES